MSFLSIPFLHPHCSSLTLPPFILYIQPYSTPYPLVSTGLDALGDKEIDQIRDLFVLEYLSSRRLTILGYFYPY